ncbi:MAG: hypothetical protein HY549_03740 [Elusimicrobia bacterium]|nr:hypothetical protein [Elusimicrobiota bacterium]
MISFKRAIFRKHGYKARLARLQVNLDQDLRPSPLGNQRLKTALTFQSHSQTYLWTTDRGRSRLVIKH